MRIIEKERHLIRFFGTKWNSRVSIKKWRDTALKQWGLHFRSGYAELHLGTFVIRYRNGKRRYRNGK